MKKDNISTIHYGIRIKDRSNKIHNQNVIGMAARMLPWKGWDKVLEVGSFLKESGIDFNFMDVERTPDSRPIHKLLIAAGPDADPLSEHFFQAYFLDGLDISDSDIQKDIVAKSGLDMAVLQASDSEAESQLTEDLDEGRMAGIEGVPMMIFSGRYSLAGAYPPDVLVSAIDACVRPASDF